MRKLAVMVLAVILAGVMACGARANVVYGEAGYETEGTSESRAWEINSAAVLVKVRDDINSGKIKYAAYYKLTSDIDLTDYPDWEPIGGGRTITASDIPDNRFTGHFDGNGHTVNRRHSPARKCV